MAKAKRYDQIIQMIRECKPKTIIEIGVWNGDRAMAMAAEALRHSEAVHYRGFDLFEEATPETNRDELNAKRNQTRSDVHGKLVRFQVDNPGFTFELTRGNTRATLTPGTFADFVYIDGGHSVETIASDYAAVKESPVVVFDDYYRPDVHGKGADITKFGANLTVYNLGPGHDIRVLPSDDPLNVGGTVHLALVRRTGPAPA